MKLHSTIALPLLATTATWAFPFGDQVALSANALLSQFIPGWVPSLPSSKTSLPSIKTFASIDSNGIERTFTQQGDITYELLTHPDFPDYRIRLKSPRLCDPEVKQYSGYLDIEADKHLFFWFFESRLNPEEAPLVLWLNGGPGCSSSTGLLFELGPCNIADKGRDTTYNPYGWNEFANMIFLDQPVNVGFSYSEDSRINNTPAAAEDVYAFLQVFLHRYKEYHSAPFSVAAESYGGHYAPHIASTIHRHNKELDLAPIPSKKKHINLSTILIGNGLTEPYTQMGSVPEQACDGPYPIYDDPDGPQCQSLRSKAPTCQRLVKSCYDYNSRFTCVPAALYCNSQLFSPIMQLGLNPYDTRRKCDRREDKDGPLCYPEMAYIETYMNNMTVKNELGVNPEIDFKSCNMDVNQAFLGQGDGMKNSAALLPELLSDGIRLLVYAGNADFMCNAVGNLQWMEVLQDHPFVKEFNEKALVPWLTLNTFKIAGKVKSAGGGEFGAGNFTYVVIHEAGHMVPYDQPEAALDLFARWLNDVPLA